MKKILIAMILIMAFNIYAQDVFYLEREKKANIAVKTKISLLRKDISQRKLTFSVGYTTALDISLDKLTGLKDSSNYLRKAKDQNLLAEELNKIDNVEFEKFKKIDPRKWSVIKKKLYLKCFSSFKSWDWRKRGKVTPVRNQKSCGSCWAFATLGAYEGSYAVRNGVKLDLSEQNLVSCSGAGSCSGGWWAFNHIVAKGAPLENAYPYTAKNDPCNNNVNSNYYKAVSWGYVEAVNSVPSVSQLKAALCTFGPLAVAVKVTPGFQAYTGGVFNENSTGNVNHGVTLIGWDDSKSAWLIKNSWGTGWGSTCDYGSERGYMWISYNSNKIGYAAAWVHAQRSFYTLPPKYYKFINDLVIPKKLVPVKRNFKKENE